VGYGGGASCKVVLVVGLGELNFLVTFGCLFCAVEMDVGRESCVP
jgi:hypothetical protein